MFAFARDGVADGCPSDRISIGVNWRTDELTIMSIFVFRCDSIASCRVDFGDMGRKGVGGASNRRA